MFDVILMYICVSLVILMMAFSGLITMGNIWVLWLVNKLGYLVWSGKIDKDAKVAKIISNDTVAWLEVPDVCYAPVMKKNHNFYKNHDFCGRPSRYGELYIEEIDSVSALSKAGEKGVTEFPNLIIIQGNERGNSFNLRKAGFSNILKCKSYVNTQEVIRIFLDGVIHKYLVYAVVDMSVAEKRKLEVNSEENFLKELQNLSSIHRTSAIPADKKKVILQCKSDVDIIMVLLVEQE